MRHGLFVIALGLVLAPAFMVPSGASAHFFGCDSVDGNELRWTSGTIFTAERDWAIAQWNAVGNVNIAPDRASTASDIRFVDVRRGDVAWAGQYECRPILADRIRFNRFFLDGMSNIGKRNVAVHELGHALGLDHSFFGQVMFASVSSAITPQSHDIADYCALWSCGSSGSSGSGGGGGSSSPRRVLP